MKKQILLLLLSLLMLTGCGKKVSDASLKPEIKGRQTIVVGEKENVKVIGFTNGAENLQWTYDEEIMSFDVKTLTIKGLKRGTTEIEATDTITGEEATLAIEIRLLLPQIRSTIIITLFIIAVLIVLRIKLRKYNASEPAQGIILYCEMFVRMMNNFAKEMLGRRWRLFSPYFITLAIFLFCANTCGLFAMTPPTSSIAVTMTLSIMTFLAVQIFGVIANGPKRYFQDLCSPWLMTPMNIIGEVAMPVSMGFRLFGNILSGVVLTGLVYGAAGWFAIILTPPLHAVFDIAFGLIQTLIFVILTAANIGNKLPE